MSLLNCVFNVLTCSTYSQAYVLSYMRAWRARVVTSLRVWGAYVLACLACLHAYVFASSGFLLVLCTHMSYMLAVLKYCMRLRAWYPHLSYLFNISKVKFQNLLYRWIQFLFGGIFKSYLNIHDGVLLRKIFLAKGPNYFCKKASS